MRINDAHITNWREPGGEWWDNVRAKPEEPLIEATLRLTLSWEEYDELLKRSGAGDLPGREVENG